MAVNLGVLIQHSITSVKDLTPQFPVTTFDLFARPFPLTVWSLAGLFQFHSRSLNLQFSPARFVGFDEILTCRSCGLRCLRAKVDMKAKVLHANQCFGVRRSPKAAISHSKTEIIWL